MNVFVVMVAVLCAGVIVGSVFAAYKKHRDGPKKDSPEPSGMKIHHLGTIELAGTPPTGPKYPEKVAWVEWERSDGVLFRTNGLVWERKIESEWHLYSGFPVPKTTTDAETLEFTWTKSGGK